MHGDRRDLAGINAGHGEVGKKKERESWHTDPSNILPQLPSDHGSDKRVEPGIQKRNQQADYIKAALVLHHLAKWNAEQGRRTKHQHSCEESAVVGTEDANKNEEKGSDQQTQRCTSQYQFPLFTHGIKYLVPFQSDRLHGARMYRFTRQSCSSSS